VYIIDVNNKQARFTMKYIISGTHGKKVSEKKANKMNEKQMKIWEEVFSAPAGQRDLARLLDFKFFIREDMVEA
jgi:hypothetical protein